jgi:hypothetical protein
VTGDAARPIGDKLCDRPHHWEASEGAVDLMSGDARILSDDDGWWEAMLGEPSMEWPTLRHSAQEIDDAGDVLSGIDVAKMSVDAAFAIASNWRSCHAFPLNTFQMGLRRNAKAVDAAATVAQRIKRLPAIQHKLDRIRRLKLSKLQDIAGCRAIVANTQMIRALRDAYLRSSVRHTLVSQSDYLSKPRDTGYRGIHLIYEYRSDRSKDHNGRKVEMQLRSRVQHAWATAVETASLFSGERLKSDQGDERWRRFFALVSTAIALREGEPPVPATPTNPTELRAEIAKTESAIGAISRLTTYGEALKEVVEPGKGAHFLLKLDIPGETLEVTSYAAGQHERANSEYMALEKSLMGNDAFDAVLVAVEDAKALRTAFPNYYADTKRFIEITREALGG